MPGTHIHVRIDDESKKQAQQIFSEMGLDISTAVNMFIKQVILNRGFPFLPSAIPSNGGVNRSVAALKQIQDEMAGEGAKAGLATDEAIIAFCRKVRKDLSGGRNANNG